MNATLIGITSGLVTILIVALLKRFDKNIIYGLILAGIGFLYVGFTWSDITFLTINIVQAIFFLVLAYFGIKRSLYFLISGYFLHGLWDLIYSQIASSSLIPPHYDLFCLTYDFIIGFYLLIVKYQLRVNTSA
jgi:hypothetical protein